MKDDGYLILKLNSSELMDMNISTNIAVITNLVEHELKLHKSFEEYVESEKNIFVNQDENDKVVLNYDDEICRRLSSEAKGSVQFFSTTKKIDNGVIYDNTIIKSCQDGVRMHIMTIDDAISIHGTQNYESICAAIAATEGVVGPYVQSRAITKFKPRTQEN